jgi:hypothetical protein
MRSAPAIAPRASVKSPLAELAAHFHQDAKLLYGTFESGVSVFLQSLSTEESALLAQELNTLLEQYPGKSGTGLVNAWLRLGAQVKPWGCSIPVALQAASAAAARAAKRRPEHRDGKA